MKKAIKVHAVRIDEKTIKIDRELFRLEVRGGHYGVLSDLVQLNAEMVKTLISDLTDVLPALRAREDAKNAEDKAREDAQMRATSEWFDQFKRGEF